MGAILFITGTDTGVGKTVLTALLLFHLRRRGCHALAMKPFCSGDLRDVHTLRWAQSNELSIDQITPHFFEAPLAPLVAARSQRRTVALPEVIARIQATAARCDLLLVEGVGGLFVPLGNRYFVVDLIQSLQSPVVLVARNRLGTLNHTLLSLAALRDRALACQSVVLMDPRRRDLSGPSNAPLLRAWGGVPVWGVPFLGPQPVWGRRLRANEKKLKKTLARIVGRGMVSALWEPGAALSLGKEEKDWACAGGKRE